MIAEGFRVVRFTGQEVYRDVEAGADEVRRRILSGESEGGLCLNRHLGTFCRRADIAREVRE